MKLKQVLNENAMEYRRFEKIVDGIEWQHHIPLAEYIMGRILAESNIEMLDDDWGHFIKQINPKSANDLVKGLTEIGSSDKELFEEMVAHDDFKESALKVAKYIQGEWVKKHIEEEGGDNPKYIKINNKKLYWD